MKKGIVMLLIVCIYLMGCQKSVPVEKIDLNRYDTPYTKCIENSDGTYSFYIYASPVQYEKNGQYVAIENTLVKSNIEEYAFENKAGKIKIYLPSKLTDEFTIKDNSGETDIVFTNIVEDFSEAELTTYTNLYGDQIEAATYTSEDTEMIVYVYATFTGLHVEYQCTDKLYKPEFVIKSDADSCEKNGNGYVVLKHRQDKEIVVYDPVIKYGEDFSLDGRFGCVYRDNHYKLVTNIKEDNLNGKMAKVDFSIERYVNKMPDSCVYSEMKKNSYLKNYAVVGQNDLYGTGWNYLRFRINYFLGTDADNVIDAEYCTKNLYSNSKSCTINMFKNPDQWSSTTMTWDKKWDNEIEVDEKELKLCAVSKLNENGWLSFNLTEFVQGCVEDITWMDESIGCCMLQNDGNYTMIASSDNSLYVPYLKITLSHLPKSFRNHDDINSVYDVREGTL